MYEPEEEPSFLSRYTVPLGVAAGLIVMAVIAFFVLDLSGGGDDDGGGANNGGNGNPTPAVSPTASGGNAQEQAIGAYVRTTLNMEYAGDCSTTIPGQGGPGQTPAAGATVPPTANRLCSIKRGDREGVAGYVLGQPLSEPTRYIFLEQRGGQWQVTYSPAITADTRAVPGIPWPLKPGAEVVVVGTGGECLNVREGPALSQAAVDCIAENTRIKLASGPADSDNRQWWQVDGRSGWVTADYLRYPDAAQ